MNELLIKIKNRLSSEQNISLLDQNQNCFLSCEFRYFYIKISSASNSQINLWWQIGSQKFTTKSFDIYESPAVYEFDLAMILASKENGRTDYFWIGKIVDFGIRYVNICEIEWVKFSTHKLTLEKENSPLIEVIDYPKTALLEVTRNCNIKCYMCRENRDEEVRQVGTNDLDYQILDKIIPFMQNVPNVSLFGWGEPLCHPNFDRLIDAISRIKERNHPKLLNKVKPCVDFTTNATLFTEDLVQSFIKNGLDEITFSIDSPNERNFNFIRKGASFNRVINNVRMLQKFKAKYNAFYPVLVFQFVAMRRNIEELPAMIQFAADLGIEQIRVTYITVVTKGLEHESLYYHQDLTNRIFDKAEKLARAKGINLYLPLRFRTKVEPQGYCNEALEMFYVRAEGTVIPCCIATDYIIGNLYEKSPEEIWQGERRKKIIDNLRNGILEGKCKDCYKFTGNDINLKETHIKV